MNNFALKNPYLKNSVETASPAQLLLMLFDGAIKFTKLSLEAMDKKNIQDAHNYNIRVQDIIEELMVTLDFNYPISKDLYSLYEYMNRRLVEGNLKKDPEPLQEVLRFLIDFRETWAEAAKRAKTNG